MISRSTRQSSRLTAAVVLFTGILAGLGPAISETRRLHTNPLMAIGGSDRVRQRWRSALVIFEIAVTVALLVVTASMVDGYRRARATQLGYATGPLLSARVDNPAGVPTAAMRERVRQIPGVAEAAAATVAPPFMGAPQERTAADRGGSNPVVASRMAIGPEFFPALGVPLRAGRAFSAQDSTGPAAAVVNETLARRLFQAQNPLGSYVWVGGTPYAVVGVVADYALAPLQPAHAPMLFLPLPPDTSEFTRVRLVIRADGDPAALVQTVRREIQDIAVGTFAGVYTVDQVLEVMQQEILAATAPLLPLVAVGLLLTVAGIYGALAFAVTRRSREIALRMAIGATTSDVARLVGRQTASLVVSGAGIGIGVTLALSRTVAAGSSASGVFDPQSTAFIVPLLLVLAVGAAAAWVPTRRAGRIDPAALLRSL